MRIVSVVALAVLLLAAPCAFASSVGNEVEGMGNLKFSAGAEGNLVYNKEIEGGGTLTSPSTTITDFEIDYAQVYGKLSVGLTDYLNLYTKLGGVKITDSKIKFASGSEIKVKSDTSFLWALGGTVTYTVKEGDCVYELFGKNDWIKDFFVGVNNEFNMWGVDVDSLSITGNVSPTNVSGHVWNWEYQLTGYVGRRFAFEQIKTVFKPYVGMLWDLFHTETDDDISYTLSGTASKLTYDLDSDDQLGIVVGADVTIFDHIILNVEGRFINETAISFGGSYKF